MSDIDFESDAPAKVGADGDTLTRLTALAALLLEAQMEGAALDAQLEEKEQAIRRLSEEDIPNLLREAGLSEIKLKDGTKIIVKDDIECSLGSREDDADRRAKALRWLEASELGGIIKTEVAVPFGRDSAEEVKELRKQLEALGYQAELHEDVHYQTLKSTLKTERERRAALRAARKDPNKPLSAKEQKIMGDIPEDIFSLRAFARATLKLPDGAPKPGKIRKRK